MTTVLDALKNAQCNFKNLGRTGASGNPMYEIAMSQLSNGIEALENGKGSNDVIQEHMLGEVNTGANEKE